MKPYRNIYLIFQENPKLFTGELEIPYTGKVTYRIKQAPAGFDENQDIFYTCKCDLKEFKCFKKI